MFHHNPRASQYESQEITIDMTVDRQTQPSRPEPLNNSGEMIPLKEQELSLNMLLQQENSYLDNEEVKYNNLSQYVSKVR